MEQDEAGTLAALKDVRKGILDPLVAAHRGRIVKVMGDGVLVEFASAVTRLPARWSCRSAWRPRMAVCQRISEYCCASASISAM